MTGKTITSFIDNNQITKKINKAKDTLKIIEDSVKTLEQFGIIVKCKVSVNDKKWKNHFSLV